MNDCEVRQIDGLIGATIERFSVDDEMVTLVLRDGRIVLMYHEQDCCESVSLYDVVGSMVDLVGTPLVIAEEVSGAPDPDDVKDHDLDESYTWTFYRFATRSGTVTLRWIGTSNGYYSDSVDVHIVTPAQGRCN